MKKIMLLTTLLVFGFAGLNAQSCSTPNPACKAVCAGKTQNKACASAAAAVQAPAGEQTTAPAATNFSAAAKFIPVAVSQPQPAAASMNSNPANCNPAACDPSKCDPSKCDPRKCDPNCLPGAAGRTTKV